GLASFAALKPAFAVSTSASEDLVRKMVAEITKVVNSGQSDKAMFRDFEKLLSQYADLPTIARYSLGVAARSASASELKSYTAAFQGYIARKYGQRFREFIGGTVEIKRTRDDGKYVVVSSTAKLRGKSPFAVDFFVSDRSGSVKVFDVSIEGIRLLTSERTEIGAIYDQVGQDIGKLTAELKRRS
ncbi:MAG: MlaC/ttg2D family ABC transporter substrate-binding protein, partial [Mangrovicoccus sp.]